MDKLRFSDLTSEQRDILCNGCGPKAWGGIKPPQFIFRASCNQHDFYYWRGGEESDRQFSDKEFYRFMKIDIKEDALWWKKPYYHTWAFSYYTAVRVGGFTCFSYGEMKDKEDLLKKMRLYNEIEALLIKTIGVKDG